MREMVEVGICIRREVVGMEISEMEEVLVVICRHKEEVVKEMVVVVTCSST